MERREYEFDTSKLDEILVPREPYIYAFTTDTIPKYLKVGDTFRGVSLRLNEWKKVYGDLNKIFEDVAKVGKTAYFRDYSVHDYLMRHDKVRLKREDLRALEKQQGLEEGAFYYSEEFFKDAGKEDIEEAIQDIKNQCQNPESPYTYYDLISSSKTEREYKATQDFDPRDNQETVIDNFKKAVAAGRKNLLMYAVMRFGKTFTALNCAKAIGAKFVVVVSAKADVADEWQKGVQTHKKIVKTEENPNGYIFFGEKKLKGDYSALSCLDQGERVVLFVTLQTLFTKNGEIKAQHKQLFERHIDLLIVDETHFGTSGRELGKPLPKDEDEAEDFADSEEAEERIKKFKTNVTLHLSGTPYKLLMGNTFEKNDVVAFVQYSDILNEKENWEKGSGPDAKTWENPYFGFPKMIRFAFDLNESSKAKLEELRRSGVSYSLNELFAPVSTEKAEDGKYYFKHEEEVLAFLKAIDGSVEDNNIFPFLSHNKIKESCLCKHMVFVLPYRASCDAMAQLLEKHSTEFINLGKDNYKVVKAVSVEDKLIDAKSVRNELKKIDDADWKSITLTVKHLLTGCTIPYWDTMLFLKETESAQEYDQAIFRLQSAFIKEIKEKPHKRSAKSNARKVGSKEVIKFDAKPQTLLIDFHPNRMFYMEENRAQVATAYAEKDDDAVKEEIDRAKRYSPIFRVSETGLQEVKTNDIMRAVSQYRYDKGIREEACEIPVDLSILDDPDIATFIKHENPIGAKGGLSLFVYESASGEKTDAGVPEPSKDKDDKNKKTSAEPFKVDKKKEVDPADQIRSSYLRMLLYAFLTGSEVDSVKSILGSLNEGRNSELFKNLGLDKEFLQKFQDYKKNEQTTRALNRAILKAHTQAGDEKFTGAEHVDTVLKKFGKLGEAAVVTPKNICADMVALIPDKAFADAIKTGKKFLDIAGTSGEFAIALYNRMKALGIPEEEIRNAIYTIPKSSICYELTRKVYTLLGLNVENITTPQNLTAYDLLDITKPGGKKELDFEKIRLLLSQNVPFATITKDDEIKGESEDMIKFGAVIGNPPYQEIVGNADSNKALGKQLFPGFIMIACKLSGKSTLITPSKWFTGKGQDGSFPKLRDFAKENNHFVKIINHLNNDIFPEISIGSLNFYLYDQEYSGNTTFIEVQNHKETQVQRPLFEAGMDIILSMNIMHTFIKKVCKNENFTAMTEITTGRNPFKLPDSNGRLNAVIKKEKEDVNDLKMYCAYGEVFYISLGEVLRNEWLIEKWKVFISKMNGGAGTIYEGKQVNIIGESYIGEPSSVCSGALIAIGGFDTREEAENLKVYLKTKFCRFMIGLMKSSQALYQIVYKYVPLQDFTTQSDIDWSKSVAKIDEEAKEKYGLYINEIDAQLYKKYALTPDEISFIESMIKSME